MWTVSESGILTGTNPPPHTFAAERSSSLSPCPPLRLIPPSWSAPAAWSSPSSPSRAFLWWGEGRERKNVILSHLQCTQLLIFVTTLSVMINFLSKWLFSVRNICFPLTHSPSSRRGERRLGEVNSPYSIMKHFKPTSEWDQMMAAKCNALVLFHSNVMEKGQGEPTIILLTSAVTSSSVNQ